MLAVFLVIGAVLSVAGFTFITDPAGRAALVVGVLFLLVAIDLRGDV